MQLNGFGRVTFLIIIKKKKIKRFKRIATITELSELNVTAVD